MKLSSILFYSVKNYIDFKSKPSMGQHGPVCNDLELPTDLIIDTLPGLSNRGRLDYSAETGLKMVRYANIKNELLKCVLEVSDQVLHNSGCTTKEDGKRLEILDLESSGNVLSMQ